MAAFGLGESLKYRAGFGGAKEPFGGEAAGQKRGTIHECDKKTRRLMFLFFVFLIEACYC